jgi:hypothetical protein
MPSFFIRRAVEWAGDWYRAIVYMLTGRDTRPW